MTVQAFGNSCLSVSVPKICYISPEVSERVTSLGKGNMKLVFIGIFLTLLYTVCSQEGDKQRCRGMTRKFSLLSYLNYAIFSDNYFACLGVKNCLGGASGGSDKYPENTCSLNSNENMWYYDGRKRDCLTFNYLGCGGNRNRFCSEEDCISTCIQFSTSGNRYPLRPYHH